MDRLKNLSILLRTIETGSFSKCAEEMNVGQPTISKAIEALEIELGVKILNRSTRSLSLTEEGRKIVEEARKVIDSYNELVSVSQLKTIPKGIVRVSCSTALGTIYLIPAIKRFMKAYPQITIQLRMTDTYLDLYENDIDVALRIGELQPSQVIAKYVGSLPRIAVASESYLKENTKVNSLADVSSHSCVVVSKAGSTANWSGTNPDGTSFNQEVNGRFVVDNFLALKVAVESGLGIGLAAKFIFAEKGTLPKNMVQVFKKLEFKPFPVHLVFKETKSLPVRTRLFIDFFYNDLRKQNWISIDLAPMVRGTRTF